jgi:hypothetical protein
MPPVLSTERIAHLGTAGDCCAAGFRPSLRPLWVISTHYRTAAFLSASPQSPDDSGSSWPSASSNSRSGASVTRSACARESLRASKTLAPSAPYRHGCSSPRTCWVSPEGASWLSSRNRLYSCGVPAPTGSVLALGGPRREGRSLRWLGRGPRSSECRIRNARSRRSGVGPLQFVG